MAEVIHARPLTSKARLAERHGTHVEEREVSRLVGADADVYDAGSGVLVARFRTAAFDERQCALAEDCYRQAAQAAPAEEGGAGQGTLLAGFHDRRDPAGTALAREARLRKLGDVICRATAFNNQHPDLWERGLPWVHAMAARHLELAPEKYAEQERFVSRVLPQFRIPDTPYTTLTVNHNVRTPLHVDQGDFEAGFACLAVVGRGFAGCHLVLPRFGLAFALAPGCALVLDVHEPHANTPLRVADGGFRLSFVAYARQDMASCRRVIAGGAAAVPVERTSHAQNFAQHLDKLQRFATLHGRLPKVGETSEGVALGLWVHNRLTDRREGKLVAERAAALERVPGWTWTPPPPEFSRAQEARRAQQAAVTAAALEALKAFVEERHRLPKCAEAHAGVNVGKWASNRRAEHKAGRLDPALAARLEGEVRGWVWAV